MTQWGLDTLFNPAKRHMDEEKRRLQSTREEVGDNSGGRRIDLESGRVVIQRDEQDADDPVADSGADNPTGSARTRKKDRPEPSAAAVRAAQRRGRTAR